MSRKITSFLMLLLAIFMSTSAMAQLDELQKKTVEVGSQVTELQANKWYFLETTNREGMFMFDPGVDCYIRKLKAATFLPGETATSQAGFLLRFIEVADAEGVYLIQYGTGNWAGLYTAGKHTDAAGFQPTYDFGSMYSVPTKYDAQEWLVYQVEGSQLFALNTADSDRPMDNNWGEQNFNLYGNGTVTNPEGSNAYGLYEAMFIEISDVEAAMAHLSEVLAQYEGYTFEAGTDPGQYGAEEVAAFAAAIAAAHDAEGNPDLMENAEALDNLAQAIIDAYNAVLASLVKYTLPQGYYRIKNAYNDNAQGGWYITIPAEDENGEDTYQKVEKYMMSATTDGTTYGRWGTPDDLTTDCPSLWYVTPQEDGTYDIQNMATDGRFNDVTKSGNITMDKDSKNLMALDIVTTFEGVTYVDIRVSTQAANDFLYLHPGGHGSGRGTNGNLVGWCTGFNADNLTFGATEWTFIPVSDEEAQAIIEAYAPIKNHDVLVAQYKELLEEAKANLDIAREIKDELTTSVEQFTCWETESTEGSVAGLIDNDATTYWHSTWSTTATGYAYIQVELPEPVEAFRWSIVRRTSGYDHANLMNIYAGNSADELSLILSDQEIGNATSGASYETEINLGAPYSVVKFEFTQVASPSSSTREFPCVHFAEFHLYYLEAQDNPNAQINFMGDLADNLEQVISEQADIEDEDLTLDDYNALKAAYDAFMTKFVNPAELRELLKQVKDVADIIEVGSHPGYWSESSDAGAFRALYEEAVAYDAAGDYTPEKSQQYIEALKNMASDIYESANKVQEGKWYRIRFGTEEEFEEHGWDMAAGKGNGGTVADLWGKYLTVAEAFADVDGNQIFEGTDPEYVGNGHKVYFTDEYPNDMALFRFVNVGDSAYLLQNKATGLFVRAAGTSGDAMLSIHPSIFNVRAIGYGQNVIASRSITGDNQNNLHAQVNWNILVTWNVDYPGSRSGLYIEEAEDVAADYDGTEVNVSVMPNTLNAFCFPMDLTVKTEEAQAWGVTKVEDTKVTLHKITGTIGGGRPFLLMLAIDDELAEEEMVVLQHGTSITATEPQNEGLLQGTFYGKTVGAGVLVPSGDTFEITKRSNTTVGLNTAYIVPEEAYSDLEATIEVIFGEGEDAIQSALANVSKSGAAYTIDGKLVSKNASLNDLSRYGKGIYILNGTKVVVK